MYEIYTKECFDLPDLAHRIWELSDLSYRDGSPWTKEQFQQALANQQDDFLFAVEEGERLVGYLHFQKVLDELEIYNIAVASERKQQGIGQQLMIHLHQFARAKEINSIFLEVRSSNQQAVSLYQKSGFKEIAIRKNYYHHPVEDGVVMQKRIE